MNSLSDNITKGTFGELFVQLKLLQYGVQASPPIKDSGNDLIAVKGEAFRAIQVKTRTLIPKRVHHLPHLYHILAVVILDPAAEGLEIRLDHCQIYLFDKTEVSNPMVFFQEYMISQKRIDELFFEPHHHSIE